MFFKQIGILWVVAIFAVIFLAVDAENASAQEDPARRSGAAMSVEVGDHGGGDPDNPVPLDGTGGHDEYRESDGKQAEFIPVVTAGRKDWDSISGTLRTAVAFLDSLLLF